MIGCFTSDALQAITETYVHDYGLDVIQPRWMEDDFTMNLIARDGTTLVAVHVVIAQPEDSTNDVAELSEDVIHEIRGAAHAWVDSHAFSYPRIRIDALVLIPMLDDLIGLSYVEGVA